MCFTNDLEISGPYYCLCSIWVCSTKVSSSFIQIIFSFHEINVILITLKFIFFFIVYRRMLLLHCGCLTSLVITPQSTTRLSLMLLLVYYSVPLCNHLSSLHLGIILTSLIISYSWMMSLITNFWLTHIIIVVRFILNWLKELRQRKF